ncbi:MAG: glycosyltransferase family 4 protein [Bacteroidaceae bacterium]|nr:glycosyltransferase family 4 protein [Bacteroidaceae bacterium]
MNVIFLTISRIRDIQTRGIYTDLMRKFRDEGHNVYIVSPNERQFNLPTALTEVDGVQILGVKILNIQKTNPIEKGLSTILLESQYKKAIEKHLGDIKFDLILYSTPPISFPNVIKYLKKRNPNAFTYLLLKDIFPQNAVDLGMFSKSSPFHWFFRRKEVALYQATDFIGCMSPANVEYVLKHNDFIVPETVEVAPNSIELVENGGLTTEQKKTIRKKYDLPTNKPVFIYGGNLGKPQGIPFLIRCLDANKSRTDCHFLVVGNGTEYGKLESWYNENQPKNVSLFARLPKEDYDLLVQSCDVGLIFLDHRFTIPNYPSRLLSYLEYKMPVIAATDKNTDIGSIAETNGYGYWCESVDVNDFTACIDKMLASDIKLMGEKGFKFLKENYLVEHTYNQVMKHFHTSIK